MVLGVLEIPVIYCLYSSIFPHVNFTRHFGYLEYADNELGKHFGDFS